MNKDSDFLKWSNLTTLKFGLYIISHVPRNEQRFKDFEDYEDTQD